MDIKHYRFRHDGQDHIATDHASFSEEKDKQKLVGRMIEKKGLNLCISIISCLIAIMRVLLTIIVWALLVLT